MSQENYCATRPVAEKQAKSAYEKLREEKKSAFSEFQHINSPSYTPPIDCTDCRKNYQIRYAHRAWAREKLQEIDAKLAKLPDYAKPSEK